MFPTGGVWVVHGGREPRSPGGAGAAPSAAIMPVKRALKLETLAKENPHEATPLKTRKKNLSSYSPTTGTCQISAFSSPTSHNVQKLGNGLSNGDRDELNYSEMSLSGRGQSQTEEYDKFMVLQSEVENSLVRFLKIRQSLTSLQALEGSRELENIFGVSDSSCNLKAEVQKTKVLMAQAEKRKLLKRSNAKHPAREYVQSGNSYEFLKSLIN
ncbi:centromere protein R isoform X2 [Malaclemys terrapin pileata]|uniref:centromere protein R isoform X2 n=1 Tax=Malaclemys terrapin pileata TaxID=2991368 RepID=UPI0023A849D5|nr:centromere protein R isoform X2 [Malaclemys terrapin pileata]